MISILFIFVLCYAPYVRDESVTESRENNDGNLPNRICRKRSACWHQRLLTVLEFAVVSQTIFFTISGFHSSPSVNVRKTTTHEPLHQTQSVIDGKNTLHEPLHQMQSEEKLMISRFEGLPLIDFNKYSDYWELPDKTPDQPFDAFCDIMYMTQLTLRYSIDDSKARMQFTFQFIVTNFLEYMQIWTACDRTWRCVAKTKTFQHLDHILPSALRVETMIRSDPTLVVDLDWVSIMKAKAEKSEVEKFEVDLMRAAIIPIVGRYIQRYRTLWLDQFNPVTDTGTKVVLHVKDWYDRDYRKLYEFVEKMFDKCNMDLVCVKDALTSLEEIKHSALYPTLPKSFVF